MIVRASARKHQIEAEDSIEAASWPLIAVALDEDNPQRELRVGFDTKERLLELVVLLWDDGTEEIIHSMKARPAYADLLPGDLRSQPLARSGRTLAPRAIATDRN